MIKARLRAKRSLDMLQDDLIKSGVLTDHIIHMHYTAVSLEIKEPCACKIGRFMVVWGYENRRESR